MKQLKFKQELLPTQERFINSTKKEVLFSGAWRAGKSKILCFALLKQVIKNPHNTVLLCRKTLESLKNSTLNTLLRGDNGDPVLPLGTYVHNKVDKIITINGGGRIMYRGLNDPIKIFSMSFGAIGLDEAIEFDKDEYFKFFGRLSLKAGSGQIFMATNPSSPGHFLYQRFFQENHPKCEVIQAKTIDNYFLPSEYIESLGELEPLMYKRYALGEWVLADQAVYSNFSRDKHVRKLDTRELYDEYIIGVDMGFKDPAVFILLGRLGGRFYVLREYYKTRTVEQQLVTALGDMVKELKNPYTIVVDPSVPSFIQTLQYNGLNAQKANNDIRGGIARIRQRFEIRNDCPDLIIDSNCVNLMQELESYQYKEGTEDPVDKFNHGPDALRYAFNYYCDNKQVPSSNFVIDISDDENDEENNI